MFKKIIVGVVVLFSITGVSFSQPLKPYEVDKHTLFLCHFDKTAYPDYSKGSSLPTGAGEIVEKGKFGKGLFIGKGESVSYKADDGNIDLKQGTIEFYLKPNWDGDDGETRGFFYVSLRKNNYLVINKLGEKQAKLRDQLGGGICSQAPGEEKYKFVAIQVEKGKRYDISSWKKGEWHHIALTWKIGEINLYVDGKRVSGGKGVVPPYGLPVRFTLGRSNCDATIDEFRISDIPREFSQSETIARIESFFYLSDLTPLRARQTCTKLGKDCFEMFAGPIPLTVKGIIYKKGLGMHSWGEAVYKIDGEYALFHALLGISDYAADPASVVFEVYGDGKRLYQSKLFTHQIKPEEIDIPIFGVKELRLVLLDGEDGNSSDHGLWLDALVLKKGTSLPASSKTGIVKLKEAGKAVKTEKALAVQIPETGETIMITAKGKEIRIPNPYTYHFSLPSSPKGYLLAEKNYLDEMTQDTPLALSEDITLSTFATPGEYEPISFVIYAIEELKDIKIEVSELRKGRSSISKKNIDIRYGMRVPQRKRYSFPPSEYLLTTRFLRNFEKIDIPEKEFKEIYLTLKVPENTSPGIYKGTLRISPRNLPSSRIALSLEVLPFKLKNPPHKKYGMYYQIARRLITPDIADLELQDMKEHGIKVLFPFLHVSYYPDAQGKIAPDYKQIERSLSILRKNGFKDMVIIGTGLEALVPLLGYDIRKAKDKAETSKLLEKDKKFLKLAKEAIEGLKNVQKKFPEFELVLTHMDEVFNGGKLPLYITLVKAAQQVSGFRYFIPFHTSNEEADRMRKEIDPYVDIRHHHMSTWEMWLARGHTIEEYKEELKKSGDIAGAYYNPVGVYYNCEWYRIIMGVENWIGPFTYHIPWRYSQLIGDPFNDLDGSRSSTIFAFYSEEDKGIVSTKIWEGWREGVDDLKYIYTLETLIKENKKKKPELTKEAEEWLKEIKSMLPKPQGLPCDDRKLYGTEGECPFTNAIAQKFTFENYQNIRYKTASYILKLMGK